MPHILTLVFATVFVFIVQRARLWLWNKIKARRKEKTKGEKRDEKTFQMYYKHCRWEGFLCLVS